MATRIALAGNPNSGKTTLFNDLTGSNQYVGNWPGVTVEKKEGRYRHDRDVLIQDLPGIYSLSPYSLEEVIARNYLIEEQPDVILNVVDGTNLERNLYLTTQLLELGLPVVVALNMIDLVRKNGDRIDVKQLSAALGCPVVETSALRGEGARAAVEAAVRAARQGERQAHPSAFSGAVEQAIAHIEESIEGLVEPAQARFFAVKLFERDQQAAARLRLDGEQLACIEQHIRDCETALGDDAESLVTNERYAYIARLMAACVQKQPRRGNLTTSDRIDRIVTNRFFALPIFVAVMFVVYYISITTIGDLLTNFTNDTLVGEWIQAPLGAWLSSIGTADWLTGLVVDGAVGGVGAVIGFVPQMLVLFLLLAILEDVGYMARVAFIMDRIFRKFGLSGKSFIPMLIGTGCGIPGIMASRTIEQERDRRMTIMTTTFIPCGAKLPIIALIAGALFGNSGWVAFSAYVLGVLAIIVSGIMLKKFKMFAGEPAPFVMELPAYHAPTLVNVLRSMWERGWSFIKKAGTIILLSTIVLWFLLGYGWENGAFGAVEDINNCILAGIGGAIAPLFAPLGFGHWQGTVAVVTGWIAKENVVATLGQIFGFAEVAENGVEYWAALQSFFTPLAAYSFMSFNLLCAPCFAAMGAIKREMNNWRWTCFAIAYMMVFSYCVALMIYQFGGLITGEVSFGLGTVAAVVVLALMIFLLVRKPAKVDDTDSLRRMSVQANS